MFPGCKNLLAAQRQNFSFFLIQYCLILQEKVILWLLSSINHQLSSLLFLLWSSKSSSLYFFICLSPSTFSPRVGSGSDHARRSLQKTSRTNAEQSESCDVDGGEERGRGGLEDKELITERGREKKWDTWRGERWDRLCVEVIVAQRKQAKERTEERR